MRKRQVIIILVLWSLMFASFIGCVQAETYSFILKWGSYGSGDGQFYEPNDIAVDQNGNVYVADTFNNRIQKFTSHGEFLTKWGSPGIGNGQFSHPENLALDSTGNVYVVDTGNNRIQKFTSDGVFINKWGEEGTGYQGEFKTPNGIAVDQAGNVYVTDFGNGRVQKFSCDGTWLASWGDPYPYGSELRRFQLLVDVAVDNAGYVYVLEGHYAYWTTISKFDGDGVIQTSWSFSTDEYPEEIAHGIAVDAQGFVYVVGIGVGMQFVNNNNPGSIDIVTGVTKFTGSGTVVTKWGNPGDWEAYSASGDGQFSYPHGVAVHSVYVYVADTGNHRIQKFALGPGFVVPESPIGPIAVFLIATSALALFKGGKLRQTRSQIT